MSVTTSTKDQRQVLFDRMEKYIRGSGQIAFGQSWQREDITERVAGKAIKQVALRYIREATINEFINSAGGIEAGADNIYRQWQDDFGIAVYNEFDNVPLTKEEHFYRETVKEMYKPRVLL